MAASGVCFLPRPSFFKNKRVIIRVDANVGAAGNRIINDFRLRRVLPTILKVAPRARLTLLVSHRGSFEKVNDYSETLSPVAKHLAKLLKRKVYFCAEPLQGVSQVLAALPNHAVVLLENIRWQKGERENSRVLAKQLAGLADVYINDAFGESHRQEASIVGITKFLPSFAGLLLQDEIRHLDDLRLNPLKPFVVVLGGAKLKTKLPLIKRFLKIADKVLLGTALANTFIAAQGRSIGASLYEPKFINSARSLLKNKKLVLPQDYLVAKRIYKGKGRVISGDVGKNELIVDIGPKTIKEFVNIIKGTRTVFWNGPMGCFEYQPFSKGSRAVAKAILNNKKAKKIIGGGETIALLQRTKSKVKSQSPQRGTPLAGKSKLFISTGGGAMLAYLAGKKLVGIEALKRINE
jgi:phosphoglycerate kinase